MPSTGMSSSNTRASAGGASLSYTDHGAPESTMPTGEQLLTSSSDAVQGSTTEKTFCSRMRRAMSCVYCAPKSRMTMDWLRTDWVSTDEFLKSDGLCKAPGRLEVACNVAAGLGSDHGEKDAASYVSTARFGRSLRIGSSRSIVVSSRAIFP